MVRGLFVLVSGWSLVQAAGLKFDVLAPVLNSEHVRHLQSGLLPELRFM